MLNSNCRAEVFQFCKLLQIVNFDGFVSFNSLIFLTAVVVFNQLHYLNHFIKDSDWLIVVCFTRV